MIDVQISTVNHMYQRRNTPGDHITDEFGRIAIRVSELDDQRMEAVLAGRQLMEVFLHSKVEAGSNSPFLSLGSMKNRSSEIASDKPMLSDEEIASVLNKVEQLLCRELGVDLEEYRTVVSGLVKQRQLLHDHCKKPEDRLKLA